MADGHVANSVDVEDVTLPGDGEAPGPDTSPPDGDADESIVLGEAVPAAEGVDVSAEREKRHHRPHPITRYRAALRNHPVRTWIVTGVAAVVLILFAMILDVAYQSYRIYGDIKGSIGVLQDAKAGVSQGTLPSATQFYDAAAKARDARTRVENADPVFRLAGNLPGLRGPIRALSAASVAAEAESRVATDLGDLAKQLIGTGGGGKGQSSFRVYHDGAVDVALLTNLPAKLQQLVVDLRATQIAIGKIPSVPMFHKVEKLKAKALKDSTQAITLLHRAILGSRLLPAFLGADGPRTYFIAIQNNADQRGTGGAVLGYAIVRFDHGRFQILDGGGIKGIDIKDGGIPVDFPPGVQWYLNQIRLAPRINNGANYTPDFPQVGASWAEQVDKVTGLHIDGSIAIDPFAIAAALKGQGALDVPAYRGEIDSSNLVRVTEHDQYTLPRKQQIRLPRQLIKSAFTLLEHPKNIAQMASGLTAVVGARDVQIWLADTAEQDLVAQLGWDGGLHAGSGDFVGLAYEKRNRGKQDFWTQETIDYRADVQPSGAVKSDYRIGVSDEIPPGQPPRIVSHVRPYGLTATMFNLYVPARARVTRVTPSGQFDMSFIQPTNDLGYVRPHGFVQHVEGAFRVLTQTVTPYPGHPKSIDFRYTTPDVVRPTAGGHVYELRITHQPLYRPAVMNITINLPPGSHVVSATKGMTVSGDTVTLQTTLTKDLTLRIVF